MLRTPSTQDSGGHAAEPFRTTHWSVVLLAGQPDTPEAGAARNQLCRIYWYPIYAYTRRRGHSHHDAQDLTQSFLSRLVEKDHLAHVDRQKGRFRSFLLAALNHFLFNDRRHAKAAKRGGAQPQISLDETTVEARYAAQLVSESTPESDYEYNCALALLDQVLTRLREENATAGKAGQFEQLQGFLTAQAEESDYDTLAAKLGMTTGAIAVAVHRMRARYRELLREIIAQTVADPADVDDEIRWLFTALGRG